MFQLICPNCKNKQLYASSDGSGILTGKKKKCVYCGKSFMVKKNILKEIR